MPVVGKLESGQLLVREDVVGPASYATATPPTVVFDDLQQGIDSVLSMMADDGRIVQIVDATPGGTTATFRILGQANTPGADSVPFREVTDAVDLSGAIYTFLAVGR